MLWLSVCYYLQSYLLVYSFQSIFLDFHVMCVNSCFFFKETLETCRPLSLILILTMEALTLVNPHEAFMLLH